MDNFKVVSDCPGLCLVENLISSWMKILKSPWKPVMVPSCPHSHIQFKLEFYRLCLLPLLLLWVYEKILFPFWFFPKLNSAVRFTHSFHLSSLKNPFPSSSCLTHCVLQHLEVLLAILWAYSRLSVSLLWWRTLGWTKHSRWGLLSIKQMSSLSLFSCWLCSWLWTPYKASFQYCRGAPYTQPAFHQDFESFCQSCDLANNFCVEWSWFRCKTLHFCFGISWDFCYSSSLLNPAIKVCLNGSPAFQDISPWYPVKSALLKSKVLILKIGFFTSIKIFSKWL